jgi:hypothetical protein
VILIHDIDKKADRLIFMQQKPKKEGRVCKLPPPTPGNRLVPFSYHDAGLRVYHPLWENDIFFRSRMYNSISGFQKLAIYLIKLKYK